MRPVGEGAGFLSSNDPRLHFGLGEASRVERLVVRWPTGAVQEYRDLPAERLVVVSEGSDEPVLRELGSADSRD